MHQKLVREFEIEIKVPELKKKIEAIIIANTGIYKEEDRDDLFNLYRIAIANGLITGIMSVTLTKIGENKTQLNSEMTPPVGSKVDAVVLEKMQDDFLTILSEGLPAKKEINP